MPIDYVGLQRQIRDYGETAVRLRQEQDNRLQACRALLQEFDSRLEEVQSVVEEAARQNKGLRCAEPLDEMLTTRRAANLPAPACTLLAADGSQINPDPHGEELYGLVNVGVLRMQPGSGEAPQVKIFSDLLYDESLSPANAAASEELIALMRDTREREILAKLAQNEAAPVITLTDGPLELYHEPRQEKAYEDYFRRYLSALDELALNRVITAGYVDRPRAALVVKMLELVSSGNKEEQPFKGVSDLALFEPLLKPGERSAVFKLQSSSMESYSHELETGKPGPKTLHFYYLNAGYENQPALARVEAPLWVVENSQAMDLLQSVLVEQSRQAGSRPYPYPLIRAHESAVVKQDDHRQVTEMLEKELISRGLAPGTNSNKQSHKLHRGRGRM